MQQVDALLRRWKYIFFSKSHALYLASFREVVPFTSPGGTYRKRTTPLNEATYLEGTTPLNEATYLEGTTYLEETISLKAKQKKMILQLSQRNVNNSTEAKFLQIKKIWEQSQLYRGFLEEIEIYRQLIAEGKEKREREREITKGVKGVKEEEVVATEEVVTKEVVTEEVEDITKKMMGDSDIRQLLWNIENVQKILFEEILIFYKTFINKDHHLDTDEVKMEIIPGVGGMEAKEFSKDLFHMYEHYCALKHYEYQPLSKISDDNKKGKHYICIIKGPKVYEQFAQETGIHRVQRIPFNSNKIQTSTSIVLIYDEKGFLNKIKNKIKFSKKDLTIETKRSSGPGGQSVNKNESRVKIIHKPTNLFVDCQKTSSQIQNKNTAIELLKNKLYHFYYEQEKEEILVQKKKQKLSGDRSEKVRTYNFLHDVVIDHILNEEFHDIENFFRGNGLVHLIEKRKQLFYQNIIEETLSNIFSSLDSSS